MSTLNILSEFMDQFINIGGRAQNSGPLTSPSSQMVHNQQWICTVIKTVLEY